MGTVGGDLCQRPRCWYYRHGFGLLAKWQGKAMVPDGDNRYHAILGAGPAYFVNPSSLAPALIALGAKVNILGPKGGRTVDLASFYRAPSADGESENVLSTDEIVTDILVPAAAGRKNATYEVREKEALDWPLAAAAVSLRMSGSTVKEAKVVLGHVAPTPWMSKSAGQALKGKSVSTEVATRAGEAAVEGAAPLSRNKYKVQLARVAVKRAVLRAAGIEEI
jgi:xanthine dehydrogenase YagS FAD-binding subunit